MCIQQSLWFTQSLETQQNFHHFRFGWLKYFGSRFKYSINFLLVKSSKCKQSSRMFVQFTYDKHFSSPPPEAHLEKFSQLNFNSCWFRKLFFGAINCFCYIEMCFCCFNNLFFSPNNRNDSGSNRSLFLHFIASLFVYAVINFMAQNCFRQNKEINFIKFFCN